MPHADLWTSGSEVGAVGLTRGRAGSLLPSQWMHGVAWGCIMMGVHGCKGVERWLVCPCRYLDNAADFVGLAAQAGVAVMFTFERLPGNA